MRTLLELIGRRGQPFAVGSSVDPPSASELEVQKMSLQPPVAIDASFEIDPSTVIRDSRYPIASSTFGEIYRCILDRGASQKFEEVAVKCSSFPHLSDAEVARINHRIGRELSIWAMLEHRYILCLYGTVQGFGLFRAVVSPWMPNGTLNSYLNRADLTEMDKLTLFKQIVEGLKYLHDNNVIHGDLANHNILVAADGSPRLANFHFSNTMAESNPAFSYHNGAVRWVAPELLDPPEDTVQCATKSSDIYALGCIMLEVLYGKVPYRWLKSAVHVVSAKFKRTEPIDDTSQIQAHHLTYMRRCWSPESRPSAEETLAFIDGLFPDVLDWPLFYTLRELPNQVITAYEHRGTVAGGLGDVWKCSWRKNSKETEVAVKSVRIPHTGNKDEVKQITEMITQEAAAWAESSHHNILPLYGTIPYFEPLPAFMFPWIANGSLTDYLQQEFSRLSETRKTDILNQVVSALKYLHDNGIAHGSLTSDDVFLDGSGRVYLAHFGRLSNIFARGQAPVSGLATTFELRYIAPELLTIVDAGASRSSKAGDIYSFGCLMIQVLLGKIPYCWIRNASEVLPERVKGARPFHMEHHDNLEINGMYLTFGQQCLSVESETRPAIEDVFCFLLIQSIGAVDLTNSIGRINKYPTNSGGYADVHRCQLTLDSTTVLVQQAVSNYQVPRRCVDVAVKAFRLTGDEIPRSINRFFREIKISSTLNHENIVPLWGVARQFGVLPALVSPWLKNGTLTQYLQNRHKELSRGQQFALLRDVARGLEYLHSQQIVHGDLSGYNVLIDDDGKARLTDFGLSALIPARMSQALLPTVAGGTLQWMAPEYVTADTSDVSSMFSQASDVYSFGGIMLQVLEGKIPYHYIANTFAIVRKISQGITPRRPAAPVIIDDDWNFIQKCWSQHAVSRPSATDIIAIVEERAMIVV